MIRQDIIDKISKYFKLSGFEAEQIYNDVFWQIIQGIKTDNLVELRDFGELIIKYSDNKETANDLLEQEFKKKAELLPSPRLLAEVNRKSFETTQDIKEKYLTKETPPQAAETVRTDTESIKLEPKKEPEKKDSEALKTGSGVIEEEMQRKREAIISKLSAPVTPISVEEPVPKTEPLESKEVKQPIEQAGAPEEEYLIVDEQGDIGASSFSDLLTEVPKTQGGQETVEDRPLVIPPAAVDLHKEITGEADRIKPPQPVEEETTATPIPTDGFESRSSDKSYYIWYKDSESSPEETKKMSYEYELLYQATKEVEYQSKLKIYISTFILFFSVVLVLLIFSPVIYKIFFIPENTPFLEIPADKEKLPESNQADINVLPPVDNTVSNIPDTSAQKTKVPEQTQQQAPQQTQQQAPEQTQQEATDEKIEGVIRTAAGWQDEKYKVIYLKLDNGKYAIQESSWDSEEKASKRVKIVESFNISGLKGGVVKADLGSKGVWFRAIFGEFGSLQETRSKMGEIRKK